MERRVILYVLVLTVSVSVNVILVRRLLVEHDIRWFHIKGRNGGSGLSERTTAWQESSSQNSSMDEQVIKPIIEEALRVTPKNSIETTSETRNKKTNRNGTLATHSSVLPEAVSTEHPQAPWAFNVTAANRFRAELEVATMTLKLFVMTQTNVKLNGSVKYQTGTGYFNITKDLYSWLPREQLFGYKKYGTCSVVGNGGILLNSGCGKKIDSADFVIRMNLPQMKMNYTDDVGKKTNLVSANPTILRDRFNSLRSNADKEAFINYTWYYQDAYLHISAFAYEVFTKLSFSGYETIQNAKGKTTNASMVFGHPQHLDLATKFWKGKYKIKERRLTSGLYLAGTALSMCRETRLYGFWPFDQDRQGRELTHHYYDNVTMSARHVQIRQHAIPEEYAVLRGLHDRGVIHMTTDRCSS
ncbi:alpha-N-acetylneuraminide alpha-2,8-sialyltransferase-like isoform X2 [Branchiostoma floridae]|uniref:Alpha-N-acetylneuraminide alpha-2,8-sialyltransferase-like isoform X2 n=1 Tax=Branchiostoma floridae TaxID=7739 RepID=A0A9J7HND8_BRAFL|nr:alpha-N-acetylneuraminide alpha-2,8-sialyltransferase-like isoform X2 [Branchiostoma floridae]